MSQRESVPSILETEATGEIAAIYADIRETLGTSVVNLIWRNLATIPGALPWTWATVRPLYLGPAVAHAEAVRRTLALPDLAPLPSDASAAAGITADDLTGIRSVLDSYHHTNALALVVLSTLLERYEPSAGDAASPADGTPPANTTELPALPAMAGLSPQLQHLIGEMNGFGEDTEPSLIASMYRHLAYWPAYLSMVHAMLAPLQDNGSLIALTRSARVLGRAHGRALAHHLAPTPPPDTLKQAIASCRLFVEHPIARMSGICALIRRATPG